MNCSIIICTHNRANSLKRTLRAVLQQEYTQGKLEVIVVDNCSCDHTRQVTESFIADSCYPVRYIYEPQLGLSNARNLGIRNAQGDIVIFIDDDAFPLTRKWAEHLVEAYHDPQVCVAGGDIELKWPNGKRPEWVHDFLLPPLGLNNFGLKIITELHYPTYPWGGNISYRKASIERLKGFSTNLGWSSGRQIISGEETELNLRLEKAGKKIVYVPDAAVQHIIFPEKLTKAWFMKRAYGQGLSDASIDMLYASTPHILFTFFRKLANVVLHFGGTIFFSILGNYKMKLFCQYNLRFAAYYVLRILAIQ